MNDIISSLQNAKKDMTGRIKICMTADMDWASEECIAEFLKLFKSYNIPLTTFITNNSDVIKQHFAAGDLQIGIHPNFANGSSHGETTADVWSYFDEILPNPKCFRSHRYFESNDIFECMPKSIKFMSNTCTLCDFVFPYLHRSGIIQFPIYFEDGAYLKDNSLQERLNALFTNNSCYSDNGCILVFNFHPMNVVLNAPSFAYVRSIKDSTDRKDYNQFRSSDLIKMRYSGNGFHEFVLRLLENINELCRDGKGEFEFLEGVYEWITNN